MNIPAPQTPSLYAPTEKHAQTSIANRSYRELLGWLQQTELLVPMVGEQKEKNKQQEKANTQAIDIANMTKNEAELTKKADVNDVFSDVSWQAEKNHEPMRMVICFDDLLF